MKLKNRKMLLICAVILVVLAGVIAFPKLTKKGNEEYVAKPVTLDFQSRVDKMADLATSYSKFGWLQIQGTDIDVPILDYASSDDLEEIDYSYGWMSVNYTTGENRPVMLGHNILNVSNEPMLPNETLENFEELLAFTYYGFASDNLYIQYTANGKDEIYLIYAAGFYDYYYDDAESLDTKEKTKDYIRDARKNSIYDYDIDVDSDDELITIRTCTRYFGANEKQQFQIDARKLRNYEETVKYQVKTNKNFKKLNLKEENM